MARVLIFEDERDLADLYQMALEAKGHEVIGIHEDPREVLDRPTPTDATSLPDLIILDERLGNVSGTSFLVSLRRAYPLARILVATADPEAAAGAVEKGADEARKKPFTLQLFLESVEALLRPH